MPSEANDVMFKSYKDRLLHRCKHDVEAALMDLHISDSPTYYLHGVSPESRRKGHPYAMWSLGLRRRLQKDL